jgi:hypothetical protein
MTPEGFIRAQLAGYAYAEAFASGGYDSMLAVACVMRNRVRAGWHGGDWIANLNAAGEYQPFAPIEPFWVLTNPNFRRVLQEIDDVHTGVFEDAYTSGGLFYLDSGLLQSGRDLRAWFSEKILKDAANHPRIAQVGNLYIFA